MKKFLKAIGYITLVIFIIWLVPTVLAAAFATIATLLGSGAGIVVIAIAAILVLALIYLILSPVIATGAIIKNKHNKNKIKKSTTK